MNDGAGPDQIEVGSREAFNNGLAQLQSNGATALITGAADPAAFHRISGHLLGDMESSRVPLFVLISQTQDIIRHRTRYPAAVHESQIVEFMSELTDAYDTRGPYLRAPESGDDETADEDDPTAEPSHTSTESSDSDRVPETPDLGILYEMITDAVEAVTRRHQIHDWDLRIVIDSCIPLLEYNDITAAVDFFDDIRGLSRDRTALTHAVYPITLGNQDTAAPGDSAEELLDAFDLHIRVRSQQGQHELQWELLNSNCRTGWLELPPVHQSLP